MSPETLHYRQYEAAADQMRNVFKSDYDLIRKSGHPIAEQANMLTPPIIGQYSLRLPSGSLIEFDAVKKAKILRIGCIDYRQVGQIYDLWGKPDLFIAVAAGASQPTEERMDSLVAFALTLFQINPRIQIEGYAHDMVCGGVNAFTNEAISKLRKELFGEDTMTAEHEFLMPYLKQFYSQLIEGGMSAENIRLGIAHIGHDDILFDGAYRVLPNKGWTTEVMTRTNS